MTADFFNPIVTHAFVSRTLATRDERPLRGDCLRPNREMFMLDDPRSSRIAA